MAGVLVALIFCTALAVGVEFTQLFFPPRTVSQNDLMAEVIGSVLGLILATRFSGWFASVIASLLQDSQRLFRLSLDAYVFAYFAFALFPFDFLLSASEIATKANSNGWGWLLAGRGTRPSIVVLRLVVEIVLTVPLGWWMARWIQARQSRRRARHREHHPPSKNYGLAIVFGLALGLLLETAQFFIASGVSQGLSIFTRLVGVVIGISLSRHAIGFKLEDGMGLIRRFGGALLLLYLLTLLEVNGWLSKQWMGFDYASEQWARVNFMPFYYHYFTTEAIALFSLAAVFLSYLPLGLLCWAYRINSTAATVLAIALATLIETGKLFLKGIHPDPTNALIAGAAIWMTLATLRLAANPRINTPVGSRTAQAGSTGAARPALAEDKGRSPATGLALAAVGCAALVWVVTLPGAPFDAWPAAAAIFFGVMFTISTAIGLSPWQWPDLNAFNSYFSPYNALRIAKGAAWAGLFWWVSHRFSKGTQSPRLSFNLQLGYALFWLPLSL